MLPAVYGSNLCLLQLTHHAELCRVALGPASLLLAGSMASSACRLSARGWHGWRWSEAIFMFFQIFAYALRPMFIKPDLVPFDGWVLCNLLAARPGRWRGGVVGRRLAPFG